MSVPDEFFQNEEEQKAPYASGIAIFLAVVLVLALAFFAYDQISTRNINIDKNQVNELSAEEKQAILDEIKSRQESTPVLSAEEKQEILNEIKERQESNPELSAEEKQAILDEIQSRNN